MVSPACFAETAGIHLQGRAGVVRAALADDGLHRIDTGFARGHHLIVPSVKLGLEIRHNVGLLIGEIGLKMRIGLRVEQHHRGERLQTRVIGPHHQPVVPHDRPLTAPRALAYHQMITA